MTRVNRLGRVTFSATVCTRCTRARARPRRGARNSWRVRRCGLLRCSCRRDPTCAMSLPACALNCRGFRTAHLWFETHTDYSRGGFPTQLRPRKGKTLNHRLYYVLVGRCYSRRSLVVIWWNFSVKSKITIKYNYDFYAKPIDKIWFIYLSSLGCHCSYNAKSTRSEKKCIQPIIVSIQLKRG